MSPYSLFVDVSYNQIRDLPLGVISNSVTNLKLAGNIITTLSQNIFITATGLRSFDISENAISYLPQNCFQYCESLSSITIGRNPISAMHEDAFLGLSSLDFLKILNTPYFALPTSFFEKLPELLYVTFSNISAIGSMNDSEAMLAPKLLSLTIDNVHLTTIPNISSPDLETYKATNCFLTSVPKLLFNRHQYIYRFVLSHNRITSISASDFEDAHKFLNKITPK